MSLIQSIRDARLRRDVEALVRDPRPHYARKYRWENDRVALRDRLAQAGFVKAGDPVAGIFPPGAGGSAVVQPFWSAPGSAYDSHHSYPGGLLIHELFNARMAAHFAQTYDGIYFAGKPRVNRDLVVAAAFYHDVMKTVVFQFNADGTLLPELQIAGTGGHHCLSGAEAIVRGHGPLFVTVLLSAHAAPSLGDEAKVVEWCRAAAMIAGVDPVEYGLLAKVGSSYSLAALPPLEAFISNLSDHDYVLTIHAVQELNPRIEATLARRGITGSAARWERHRILSSKSAVALYADLVSGNLSL